MKRLLTAVCVALMTVSTVMPALAQSIETTRFLQILNSVNTPRPDQSGDYERTRDVISGKVTDTRNKVVGDVKDVILNENGSVKALYVDFNRLRMGNTAIYVDFRDFRTQPTSGGYKIGYTQDQLEEIFPSLLANMESAAGGENTHSARKLVGKDVRNESGRKIGKVNDVLFNSNGGRAELLYIAMIAGALRGKNVAIPFNRADYKATNRGVKITVSDDQAKAMVEYAESK